VSRKQAMKKLQGTVKMGKQKRGLNEIVSGGDDLK
jgi:hypothetical protein